MKTVRYHLPTILSLCIGFNPVVAEAGKLKKAIIISAAVGAAVVVGKKIKESQRIDELKKNSPEAALEDDKTYIPPVYPENEKIASIVKANEKSTKKLNQMKKSGWVPSQVDPWCGPGAITAQYQMALYQGTSEDSRKIFDSAVEWIKTEGSALDGNGMLNYNFVDNANKIVSKLAGTIGVDSAMVNSQIRYEGERFVDAKTLSSKVDNSSGVIVSLSSKRLWGYLAGSQEKPSYLKNYFINDYNGTDHYVMVFGIERNVATGAPEYFHIADTGIPDPDTWVNYSSKS